MKIFGNYSKYLSSTAALFRTVALVIAPVNFKFSWICLYNIVVVTHELD